MSDEPKITVEEVARLVGTYPVDAYYFLQEGLAYTAQQVHGDLNKMPEGKCHVSGQQLCEGLRHLAIQRWGRLAQTVLARWGITETLDFGRLVFALVDHKLMHKQPSDKIEDFEDVYDFEQAFNSCNEQED